MLVFPREEPDRPIFRRYEYDENDFCVVDGDCNTGVFVNLLDNPERFTGYAGAPAAKIWDALYRENCFLDKNTNYNNPLSNSSFDDQCYEKRVFFKVVSGLHSSISIHIADQFYNSKTGNWEKNFEIFHERVGKHPERLQNMYLVYMLILRAVEKLCSRLENYNFGLVDSTEEQRTKELVMSIAHRPGSCPSSLDPRVFSSSTKPAVVEEFKNHFRNISQIMDCVGCEKCRLWGKIQVTGIGTALKILFASESPRRWDNLNFRRSEIVALFNTLGRLSESVVAVQYFRKVQEENEQLERKFIPFWPLTLVFTVLIGAVIAVCIRSY